MPHMGPLVTADWLARHLDDVVLVDCRFELGDHEAGHAAYLRGHLPGASFLRLDRDLSGTGGHGRHPLPTVEEVVAAADRAGIVHDRPVVAYDQGMVGGAARLWWLLRSIGKHDVAVLEGGLGAWDGPLEAGEVVPPTGDLEAGERWGRLLDAEDVRAGLDGDRLLVDARAPERFSGEHEPIDPVAGHIPGAVNVPYDGPVPPELLDPEREVVVYCGSGVTACVVVLRLAAAGRDDVGLYAGSWSDWSSRGLPVETGPSRPRPGQRS
jgi:thiosulfate/3-mercaptopyruvate sulfurtransferase